MTIETVFGAARFMASAVSLAESQGLFLELGADFQLYAERIALHRQDQPVGSPFDHDRHVLRQVNGFWIMGRNRQGQIVHTQAMRLIDLAGDSLSDYLKAQFRLFPPAGVALDLQNSEYRAGPWAGRIRGKTCYHGEVWLTESWRGTGMSTVLVRLAFALCLLRWSPDYVFGFMPKAAAFKGLATREGYMHHEPGCLRWRRTQSGEDLEGFLVWQSRADIEHIIAGSVTGDGFE